MELSSQAVSGSNARHNRRAFNVSDSHSGSVRYWNRTVGSSPSGSGVSRATSVPPGVRKFIPLSVRLAVTPPIVSSIRLTTACGLSVSRSVTNPGWSGGAPSTVVGVSLIFGPTGHLCWALIALFRTAENFRFSYPMTRAKSWTTTKSVTTAPTVVARMVALAKSRSPPSSLV